MTASVLPAASVPAATLTIWRSLPAAPTETVLATLATEPVPIATEFDALALAPWPIAVAPVAPALLA